MFPLSHQFFEFHRFSSFSHFLKEKNKCFGCGFPFSFSFRFCSFPLNCSFIFSFQIELDDFLKKNLSAYVYFPVLFFLNRAQESVLLFLGDSFVLLPYILNNFWCYQWFPLSTMESKPYQITAFLQKDGLLLYLPAGQWLRNTFKVHKIHSATFTNNVCSFTELLWTEGRIKYSDIGLL